MAAGIYDETLWAEVGARLVPLKNATVTVRKPDGTNASLRSWPSGATAIANPTSSDTLGDLRFVVPDDTPDGVDLVYTPPGQAEKAKRVRPVPVNLSLPTDVRDHGAARDGVTDDTTAVLNARTAAGVGGTVLFSGPGTYLVGNLPANIANQTWVIPAGTTVKAKNLLAGAVVDVTAGGFVLQIDGTLDGNKANQDTTFQAVARMNAAAANARVTGHGKITRSKKYGLLGEDCQNLTLRNFDVEDTNNIGVFVHAFNGPINGLDIFGVDVDRTMVPAADLLFGGINVRGSDDGVTHALIEPRVNFCTVKMPENPDVSSKLCIEIWATRPKAMGNATNGGAMGLSVWGPGALIGPNAFKGATVYGLELVQSNAAQVAMQHIDGFGADGVTRRTGTGIVLNESSDCVLDPQSIRGIKAGGEGIRVATNSSARPCNDNTIGGGNIEVAGAGAAVAVVANVAGSSASRNVIGPVQGQGDGTAGSHGIRLYALGGGTVDNTTLALGTVLDSFAIGVNENTTTNTRSMAPIFVNCPTTYGGSATGRKRIDISGAYLELHDHRLLLRNAAWHDSIDFVNRMFFSTNGSSIWKGAGAAVVHEWRGASDVVLAQLNATLADGETAWLVRRNVAGTQTVQRVSMGAMDSGGVGFKVLRVPN